MTNENLHFPAGNGNSALVVQAIEGEARILDTDLAARLGFGQPRDIRKLIKRYQDELDKLGPRATVARVVNGGNAVEHFLNRKQAIFITAKSETPTATDITIEIIERFDAYERGGRPAIPDLSDPVVLTHLLMEHASKRIEAEQRAAAAERVAGAAKETVEAFDRIAGSAGSLCITDAAKALQLRPKDLFGWLRSHGWIYSRVGHAGDIAYQDKIKTGYLEHKVTTVTRNDGSDKTVERVRVTPKGLAKLAKDIPGATPPSAPSAMIAAE